MTILNTFTACAYTPVKLILLLFVIFAMIFGVSVVASNSPVWSLTIGLIGVLFACTMIFLSGETREHTYYNVTFDDSVNINDVLSKYTIISNSGKIYTLEAIDYE